MFVHCSSARHVLGLGCRVQDCSDTPIWLCFHLHLFAVSDGGCNCIRKQEDAVLILEWNHFLLHPQAWDLHLLVFEILCMLFGGCRTHCHSLRVLKCGSKKNVLQGVRRTVQKAIFGLQGAELLGSPVWLCWSLQAGPIFFCFLFLTNSALSRRQPQEKKKVVPKAKNMSYQGCARTSAKKHIPQYMTQQKHTNPRICITSYSQVNRSILYLPDKSMGRKLLPYSFTSLSVFCAHATACQGNMFSKPNQANPTIEPHATSMHKALCAWQEKNAGNSFKQCTSVWPSKICRHQAKQMQKILRISCQHSSYNMQLQKPWFTTAFMFV